MRPYIVNIFGNPHSIHSHGEEAKKAVDKARGQVANLINSKDNEIIFTGGATESNNQALKGFVSYFLKKGKNHIITCQTEHKSVLETCKFLEKEGVKVTYLPVKKNGLIDIGDLKKAITKKTFLVSIMIVNNEIGVIQPIKRIGEICDENQIIFHTDGAQAVGKIPIDVNNLKIDLLSMSSHKSYGPKGIGALYIKNSLKNKITPLIHGGAQEEGLRSGTLPVFLIVGIGKAFDLAKHEMKKNYKHVKNLSTELQEGLSKIIPGFQVNGDLKQRIHGNLNISGLKNSFPINELEKVASISKGSACSCGEASHVLKAIGFDFNKFFNLRFGIGRLTTKKEIKKVLKFLKKLTKNTYA